MTNDKYMPKNREDFTIEIYDHDKVIDQTYNLMKKDLSKSVPYSEIKWNRFWNECKYKTNLPNCYQIKKRKIEL